MDSSAEERLKILRDNWNDAGNWAERLDTRQASVWVTLVPDDIELIVDLIVERLESKK